MPDSLTNRFTVFLLERVDLGNFSLESGLRYEHANLTADGGRTERNFNAVSLSLGLKYEVCQEISLTASRRPKLKNSVCF